MGLYLVPSKLKSESRFTPGPNMGLNTCANDEVPIVKSSQFYQHP